MSVRTSQRIASAVGPFVAAALVLGACGAGSSDAQSRPTIELAAGETSFETLAPATTLPVPAEGTEESDGTTSATSSEYTVKDGDFPFNLAIEFGVSLDELATLNGWAVCGSSGCPEFPAPGGTIRAPAGSAPAVDDATETDPAADPDATPADPDAAPDADPVEGETGEAIPEPAGDACDAGSYPIESGDFEGSVADKFDISVDELREANAQTTDYNVFYVGLEIVIPARDNC